LIVSESILQKRIKRFKSIKRGYYSLIALIIFYILALLGPLWINNKPLILKYNNDYYFPAIVDLLDFIPGINYPLYESKTFGQAGNRIEVDFRKLEKQIEKKDSNDFILMPIYPYHPHEDLKDQLDEEFEDMNNNNIYNLGEPFIDENRDGIWNENHPPTLPAGFKGRHLLGTDNTGRDVFVRIVDGYKISITFALIVTTLSYIIGIMAGSMLGYYAGKIDLFGVRLMEIFSAIPFLFILMILASFMQPNVILLASLSVILKGWIGITYYVRGEFFREKAKDYVSAAVSMGTSPFNIMFKHILPNSLTPIITSAPFAIIGDIFTLVSLDFLGYGLRPPTSSWGNLLQQAAENLDNWHMLIFPVIVLTLTIFMITFISEAIREAFDPKIYSRLR
jgi:microcin C transport system permease protein